jgi:NAD(P)-dependent dehydrogenase (short-subunit alcohol dehydrogenase family)
MTLPLLEGKAVVVTGAGRGLGRAYALDAARHGAAVVVNDVDRGEAEEAVAAIEAAGGTARVALGSVSDRDAAASLVARCVEDFGRIDGLVNNAGLFHAASPWEEDDEARLRRTVEVNVLGPLFCGIAALKEMRRQGSGSIVNATSGAHLGLPGISTYGTTKGAVTSMTFGWAVDAPAGVRVNAISPTAFTRMTDGWDFNSVTPKPLPPGEIAPLVTYLLSDLSEALNGQVLRLDGRALSLLRKAYFDPEAAVESDAWDPEAIASAVGSGRLGDPAPVGMAHPATISAGARSEQVGQE